MGVCPNSLRCPAQSGGLGEAGRPGRPGLPDLESLRPWWIRGAEGSLAPGAVR
jgi:hypothetical protein